MRALLWTVFLVVAAQGIDLAPAASASPLAAEISAPADTRADANAARLEARVTRAQPSLHVQSERKVPRSEAQVLSKNYPRPKPVQIYWFFGGR